MGVVDKINHFDMKVLETVKRLDHIHVTWKDYALLLLNSTAEPLRSIWQEKVVTSFAHWNFNKGSISEGNILGAEILEILPSALTEMVVDDHFEKGELRKMERLAGSKRMNVFLGHYPQESLSNEAALCLANIVKHWDEPLDQKVVDEAVQNGYSNAIKTYGDLILCNTKLNLMWQVAQMGDGNCVLPDEVLTWILDRPVDDKFGFTIPMVTVPVLHHGKPEGTKYGDYWKTARLGDRYARNGELVESDESARFPLHCKDQENLDACNGLLDRIHQIWENANEAELAESVTPLMVQLAETYQCDLDINEQKKNFLKMCEIGLKEDVAMSPCWKKICICILKNDVSFKYAGFAPTYRERVAREQAMDAFDTKKKADEEAKRQALAQVKEIEEQNAKN